MNDALSEIANGPDGPLHSLVWMAQDANISLPPIPQKYIDRLREVSPMCCFATDDSLVAVTNRAVLSDMLTSGKWPTTGMALRLVPKGRWLYWQYILVGRANLLLVNLRFELAEDLGPGKLALVSEANECLETYLQDEIVLARYLADWHRDADEAAHIVVCENETAPRMAETHYTWTETGGLSKGRSEQQIFGAAKPRTETSEEMLLRL